MLKAGLHLVHKAAQKKVQIQKIASEPVLKDNITRGLIN
jgi:hypothetical protein